MELSGAWDVIIQQGPLFAFMALVIYNERKRSESTEARLNAIVDNIIQNKGEEAKALAGALNRAAQVMERVERKLDDASH